MVISVTVTVNLNHTGFHTSVMTLVGPPTMIIIALETGSARLKVLLVITDFIIPAYVSVSVRAKTE